MFAWLRKDISQLNIIATYDLIYNASRFVKMGFGYAITLDKLINTSGNSNLCFRPLYPVSEAGLCIVWKSIRFFESSRTVFKTDSSGI